jgi:hypothetical protein
VGPALGTGVDSGRGGDRLNGCGITQKPFFPRSIAIREKLVDKFHQQATVLHFQVLNPKPTACSFGWWLVAGADLC